MDTSRRNFLKTLSTITLSGFMQPYAFAKNNDTKLLNKENNEKNNHT